MPGSILPPVPQYNLPPPTKEPLEFADLAIVDLSKANTPEGRAELAIQVRDAMSKVGFFYAVNHGLSPSENKRVLDIADVPFTGVEDDEKQLYLAKIEELGTYQGYKLRNVWTVDAGVRDQVDNYNFNKNVYEREHPKAIRPFLPELDAFARFCHFNVVHQILRLMALGLELPEDTFIPNHRFSAPGDTYLRFMKYYPRSEDDEIKTKNVWMKGHTVGTVTALWSQPVSGLQIKSPDGNWRWVRHIDNALVINSGDAMEFFSGGFYKATIHRVVQPPADQRGYARLGVFYFGQPDNDAVLAPLTESPVLQRYGVRRRFEDADAPTMETYRTGRIRAFGLKELQKKENGVEETDITS
ncbi:Clavaminate synthase-like protein [Wolfiporia cocos MD-104 SS10]|uniref:Clavaminate synthase-like protein n=1 Tax=Wolfiporia cocos (strain MD-104) TaxID=742152 RepID=A0A2H3J4Q8_WOLCO|nr:Clavaminate synthase-like protein [Wolfiporia cocos MD-104 SS10]